MKSILINPGIIKRIKKLFAPCEDTNIASRNYAVGKYFIWKNQLCQSKTAITTGDTLSELNLRIEENGLASKFSGDYNVLATITSSGTKTIDDITNYRYVMIAANTDSKHICNSLIMPTKFILANLSTDYTYDSRYLNNSGYQILRVKFTSATQANVELIAQGEVMTGFIFGFN